MTALARMESLRHRELARLARFGRGHVPMLEPFVDTSRGFWRCLEVFHRDSFRGRIAGLRRHGLEPEPTTAGLPQHVQLGACPVPARKLARAEPMPRKA